MRGFTFSPPFQGGARGGLQLSGLDGREGAPSGRKSLLGALTRAPTPGPSLKGRGGEVS